MRKLLVAFLLASMAWGEPAQVMRSYDGRAVATRTGEKLSVRVGGVVSRWSDVSGSLVCVSAQGKVATYELATVKVYARGTYADCFEVPSCRAAWFDEKDPSLWVMTNELSVCKFPLGLGTFFRPPGLKIRLLPQLKNPQCPKEQLLLRVGKSITREQLDQMTEVSPWTRLALEAYHGDQRSGRTFAKVPLSRYEDWRVWLEAARLGGDEIYRAALRRALGDRSWEAQLGDESTGPWDRVLSYTRKKAEPWLLEWLNEPNHTAFFHRNVLRALQGYSDLTASQAALERLARGRHAEVAELALSMISDKARLVRLLPQFPQILRKFDDTVYAGVVPAAIELLTHKSSEVRERARRVLYFQTRVELGNQPEPWRKWLKMTPEERRQLRLAQSGQGQEARLLLQARLGQLKISDLSARIRAVRCYPDDAELSGDGRWVFVGTNQVWSPVGERAQVVPTTDEYSYDAASARFMTWSRGAMAVREPDSARPIGLWQYDKEQLGEPLGLVDSGRMVEFERGLVDARNGRVLWNWTIGSVYHVHGRLALLNGDGGQSLWDWQSQKRVRQFPDDYGTLLHSDDFQTMLWRGDRSITMVGKGAVYPLGLLNSLSPDGKWLVQLNEGEARIAQVPGPARVFPYDAHSPKFSPDSQLLAWMRDSQIEVRRPTDLSLLASGGSADCELGEATFDRTGRWLCVPQMESSLLYEVYPQLQELPPREYQQLFSELWTGKRLRAGLAVPLSQAEYEKRRREWRELCQRDWVVSPNFRAVSVEPLVPWQVFLTFPLLGAVHFLRRKPPGWRVSPPPLK